MRATTLTPQASRIDTLKYRQRPVACRVCGDVHAELVPWAEARSRSRVSSRIRPRTSLRHRDYIRSVVDHVATKVVWAAEGESAAVVEPFFKALGPERAAKLKGVTIDMSGAFIDAVHRGAPQAQIIFDRFSRAAFAQNLSSLGGCGRGSRRAATTLERLARFVIGSPARVPPARFGPPMTTAFV